MECTVRIGKDRGGALYDVDVGTAAFRSRLYINGIHQRNRFPFLEPSIVPGWGPPEQ
jgi:hypothetical protein